MQRGVRPLQIPIRMPITPVPICTHPREARLSTSQARRGLHARLTEHPKATTFLTPTRHNSIPLLHRPPTLTLRQRSRSLSQGAHTIHKLTRVRIRRARATRSHHPSPLPRILHNRPDNKPCTQAHTRWTRPVLHPRQTAFRRRGILARHLYPSLRPLCRLATRRRTAQLNSSHKNISPWPWSRPLRSAALPGSDACMTVGNYGL